MDSQKTMQNKVIPSDPPINRSKSKIADPSSDLKMQFRTTDINMASDYTKQTKRFKDRLKKMREATNMGFKFA